MVVLKKSFQNVFEGILFSRYLAGLRDLWFKSDRLVTLFRVLITLGNVFSNTQCGFRSSRSNANLVAVQAVALDKVWMSECIGVPKGSNLGLTFFLIYIDDLPGFIICNIVIYNDALLSTLNVIGLPIWSNSFWNWLRRNFVNGQTELLFFDRWNNSVRIDVKLDWSNLD